LELPISDISEMTQLITDADIRYYRSCI